MRALVPHERVASPPPQPPISPPISPVFNNLPSGGIGSS